MIPARFRFQVMEALRHGGDEHSLDDVESAIQSGDAMLWQNEAGLLVTEIYETPRTKGLNIWLAAGELDAVLALSDEAAEIAKGLGLDAVTMVGRRGWEKVLKRRGWHSRAVVMGRDL